MDEPDKNDVILFCNRIEVGCCIILNDVDQPCAKLLAVITKIDGRRIQARYLNADKKFDSYNKASGCTTTSKIATPVGWFGVMVRIDADGLYWCEQVLESCAKYPDGLPRQWQDRSYGARYVARPDVLDIAKSSA